MLAGICSKHLQKLLQQAEAFQLLLLLQVLEVHMLCHIPDQSLTVGSRQLCRCIFSLAQHSSPAQGSSLRVPVSW